MLPGTIDDIRRSALRRTAQVDTTSGVCAYVLATAAGDPERVAIVDAGRELSYGGLVLNVWLIRTLLLGAGVVAGDGVAVTGPRCAETVATFLALEGLGCVYLPLDSNWPTGRFVETLRSTAVRCLVQVGVDRSAASCQSVAAVVLAAAEAEVALLTLSQGWEDSVEHASSWTPRTPDYSEPRYVIHTSGSTGRPKGAVIEHRGMMNHLWSMVDTLCLESADRVAFTAPTSYVISVWQMLAVLVVGGAVAVVDEEDVIFPRRLLTALQSTGITVLQLVPSAIGPLVDHLQRVPAASGAIPGLRCLVSTGEALSVQLASLILEVFPRATLVNAYGASECSDDVTHYVVRPEDLTDRIPLGRPIVNTSLYLLVEQEGTWRRAAEGETGELWVGGTPVSLGYLNEPALTRERFFADCFDQDSPDGRLYRTGDLARTSGGQLYCLGRSDRQVKIAGARVELDAVECELARHPAVRACAVTVGESERNPQVTAHYVSDADTTWQDLQEFLRGAVPGPMVPRRWIRVDEIPLNDHGKSDYRRLTPS